MTFLIIDVGSSSVRALLVDDRAQVIPDAVAALPHQFQTDQTGMSVADPLHLRMLVENCIDTILQHPLAASIRAVGMATFVGNLLGAAASGAPLTPLYTYADTRSHPDIDILHARIDAEAVHQRTGCRMHTAYHPARLHWLKRTQPDTFAQVVQWLDFGTWLYRGWFGAAPCSYSIASWGGLLNRQHLTWDTPWCELLGVAPDHFPVLTDYDTVQRGLLPRYAARWSALREIPFLLAVGDGAAANVGSGAVQPGVLALTVGTTAAVRTISTELKPVPAGLWSYRVDQEHHLTGGATSEGGSIFAWVSSTVALPHDAETQLMDRLADAHGLTFLPLLAGERAPGWNTHASGTLHGLRLATTPTDILQAALEGVALRLAVIADQVGAAGQPVYAGGGALAASAPWAQIMTDALNRPLHLLAEPEITARGMALLLLHALDGIALDAYPPQIARTLTPRTDAADRLHAARQRQSRLYQQLYGGDLQR